MVIANETSEKQQEMAEERIVGSGDSEQPDQSVGSHTNPSSTPKYKKCKDSHYCKRIRAFIER
jgi:hypothetical protein